MPHVFGWTFSLNSVTPRSPWPPPPVGKKSWTLPDVLIVLTKGSPWCHLPNLWPPDLEIQALTNLLASSNRCPPPRTLACCRHLTGRAAGPPPSASWQLQPPARFPAGLLFRWHNRTQKNKAPRLSLPPLFTWLPGPPERTWVLWPSARTAVGLTAPH